MKRIDDIEMEVVRELDGNYQYETDGKDFYVSRLETVRAVENWEKRSYYKVEKKVENGKELMRVPFEMDPDFVNEYWMDSGKVKGTWKI